MSDFEKDKVKWGKRLGKGSFGEVFEIEYKGEKYAGKVIPKSKLVDDYMKEALLREIDILEKMSKCDNSVKLYAHYKENDNEIIILELCDCELEDIVNNKSGGFDTNEICSVMKGLNNAFSIMHLNNIMHRDLKLENIMVKYIDKAHKKYIPKINDYGLSKQVKSGVASTLCGSPIFMAPELFISDQYTDKADLWSIGVMMYYMYFKEFPYEVKMNIFNLPANQIKNIFNQKKKKDAKDKLLDDLLNRLLTFDVNKRISWNDYLNHPFFNKGRELFKKVQTMLVKDDPFVIKIYDYILEEMILLSYLKEIENELILADSPDTLISIDDCLNSGNDEFYILGIVGQYLEDLGITCLIEKDDKPKNDDENHYNRNIMQFICNGYIWKFKYLLDFELGYNRITELVQDDLKRCQFNEKLKKAMIKAFNLSQDELIITNYKRDKQNYRAVVVFKSNFNKNITKNELLKIFINDNELKTLKYIEKKFVIPSIKLSRTMLSSKGNVKNNNFGQNDTRGGEIYYPPNGWIRYGLNVSKQFDKGNDNWLGFNHKKDEWCIAYAPFTGIDVNIPQTYKDDDDAKHSGKVGVGLYCPSKPELMEARAETIKINGTNYKIGFMMRVKPGKIRSPKSNKNMWVLSGNTDEVRPYGILIKKI